jgi:hypothetical protein
MKQVRKAELSSDELAETIVRGMRQLREENAALHEENAALRAGNDELEHRSSMLLAEIAGLKSQLDNERTERRHYHSLANEIITRLDVVGRTVDDVVRCAQQEVYRQHKEHPRGELVELAIPPFLKASADPPAEPKADAPALTRDRTPSLAGIMLFLGVATGLAYTQLPPAHSVYRFADGLMARTSADLAQLDESWQRERKTTAGGRDIMPGALQCADDVDPQRRSGEIANRIEAGQWVVGQCLQVRLGR